MARSAQMTTQEKYNAAVERRLMAEREQQVRGQALGLALDYRARQLGPSTPAQIVSAARVFETYLRGKGR